MSMQIFREPWQSTKEGIILDCTGESRFVPSVKPDFNSNEYLALRVVTCVNALRSQATATVARAKFLIKPDKDHVVLASEASDLLDWCKSVLEDAGYEVKEKP